MKRFFTLFFIFCMFQFFSSCRTKSVSEEEQVPVVSVKTTSLIKGDIENIVSLNGKTVYLRKNIIVSPISGYIIKINAKYGETVQKDNVLFEIQTKENKALENTGTFNESNGIIKVLASAGGNISEMNIYGTGGYILEGSALCSIVETNDFVIQMNVPFQYISMVKKNLKCKIILPDNTELEGYVYNILPVINGSDQTQNVLIKPSVNRQLPENLNLLVQFVNIKHNDSFLITRDAVMTNEIQSEFWVMKIYGNNLAVKIPVIKGIESDSIVEISSPDLKINDLLISAGAYGMADSTIVKIEK